MLEISKPIETNTSETFDFDQQVDQAMQYIQSTFQMSQPALRIKVSSPLSLL